MSTPLPIDEHVTIPADELEWSAARSSGPGGQNVNRVSSKVDLRFDLEGSRVLRPDQKARLRVIARGRLDADGRVQVVSQSTRDQARNLEIARETLRVLIARSLVPPRPRRKTRPTRASKERRLEAKRRLSDKKRDRKEFG